MRIYDLFGGAQSIYLRLYRRVIEIRDAILILHDYVRPEILEQARQHVTAHNLSEDQIEPAITACWLEVARQAKMRGIPPHPNSFAFNTGQKGDFSNEIDFMIEIARARKSPLIASFSSLQTTLHGQPLDQIQQRSQ